LKKFRIPTSFCNRWS